VHYRSYRSLRGTLEQCCSRRYGVAFHAYRHSGMQVVALAGEAGVLLLLYDEDQVRGCSADVKDKVRGSCVIASVKKVGETSADNF